MPEQQSSRGNVITTSDFQAPFQTQLTPLGMGGLNLAVAIDQIPPTQFARLYDITWIPGEVRAATGRPGLLSFATTSAALDVNSIVRMNDAETASTMLFYGVSTTIRRGAGGALTTIDTGYADAPKYLLPHRPPLSSDPWLFVGDSTKMRQIRFDGVTLPIGLPAPANAVSASAATMAKTTICNCAASDGTAASNWTAAAGFTYDDPPATLPPGEIITPGGPPDSSPAIQFGLLYPSGFLAQGGAVWFGCPMTRNLSVIGGREATDEDLIHLWLYFTQADLIAEFRVYFVCSSTFSTTTLPGTDGTTNADAYVKSFSANDFAAYIQAALVQNSAAELARVRQVRDTAQRSRAFGVRRGNPTATLDATLAARDPARNISTPAMPGSEVWQELGMLGLPLRRGEWQRIGNTSGRDWSTITGMVTFIRSAPKSATVGVGIAAVYLTGGNGPDTTEPDATPYDYRYTHYDTRTGDEGNPSPVMAETAWVDSIRQAITVTPVAFGDSSVRQRFYRRGGFATSDWHFLGQNTSDGGVFTDRASDTEAQTGGALAIDHYQPVPTVSDTGATILAQPVPVIFGPYQGQLFALGDPHRPGYVYASLPGQSGAWPPDLAHEVCAPSEALQAGLMWGGQPFVFSTLRGFVLYPNISGAAGMTSTPSGCTQGLVSPWAWCTGAGSMWGVSKTCVFRTGGGPETIVSQKLEPLFRGQTVNGYLPISFNTAVLKYIRLAVFRDELYFQYRDTGGNTRVMVLQILTGEWRTYRFAHATSAIYPDVEPTTNLGGLLFGGATTGKAYFHLGTDDDGTAIAPLLRTGALDFSHPREEKLFGDQILDLISNDVDLTWQNYMNAETVANPVQVVPPSTTPTARARVILDSFGTAPQRARSISTEIAWTTTGTPPVLYFLGTAITLQPDLTMNRVTNWDDLGSPDESYVTGITFDCDTGGNDRTIHVERDFGGVISIMDTLTVNANGRHKLKFSWPAAQANQVRIRPESDCGPWILYRADWIAAVEPPRIANWDIHFEGKWDQYHTGLDLYCDTNGLPKTIVVEVDGTALTNPETGDPEWIITTNGRRVVHLTLPWGRGHVYRFYATDDNPGLLYTHRWHTIDEPSEQANWNQPFTILGTQADKYLKAVIFEIDTFGQTKTVQIQADETTALTTVQVSATGRQVVQVSFAQVLGRVFRFFPVDNFPSRLYSIRPIFDEEPFSLTRWETQLIDHGIDGFHTLMDAMVTLLATADVILTITTQLNQATGVNVQDTYTIPATAGAKVKRFVSFVARKGVLTKYVFTSAAAFRLYGAESYVRMRAWQGGAAFTRHPFGDDDADETRQMVNSTLAAGRSGGEQ